LDLKKEIKQEDVRMYSKEEREEAIKLYIKYDKCAAAAFVKRHKLS